MAQKFAIKKVKVGRAIYPKTYGERKYRSLRYITPKNYELHKIDKKNQVVIFKKIKEKEKWVTKSK